VSVWKVLFPFPYESTLRREAERNDFDPMFAAGLIRQESTFQADVVSYANAIGLMQILPKTGRILAKQRKIRYTRASLFDPDINIIGMPLAVLLVPRRPRYAAAAHAGRSQPSGNPVLLRRSPGIVESIPFRKLRYVQIVRCLHVSPNLWRFPKTTSPRPPVPKRLLRFCCRGIFWAVAHGYCFRFVIPSEADASDCSSLQLNAIYSRFHGAVNDANL
jgi:hypothetical protein